MVNRKCYATCAAVFKHVHASSGICRTIVWHLPCNRLAFAKQCKVMMLTFLVDYFKSYY